MKPRDFNVLDQIILFFLGGVLLMSFPANLLRLSGDTYFREEYSDHLIFSYLVLALLSASFAMRAKIVEIPQVILFLIFLFYILSVGMLSSNGNEILGLRFYVLPLIAYMLLLGRKFVLFFYTSKSFWLLVTGIHIIGLMYYFGTLFGTVYPGIGVLSIAYAAIFFFCNSYFFLFAMAILVMFLEAKRSIILSVILTVMFLRLIRYQPGLRALYFFGAGFAAIVILSIGLIAIADIEGNTTITRINYLNPYSNSYNLLMGSSGRMGELLSFFGNTSLSNIMIGSGSGFQYEWSLGYASSQEGEIKGYFHMSPANYLAAGGLFGVLVFMRIALMPFRARGLKIPLSAQTTAFGMGLLSIIYSFFAFSLATDLWSWMFIIGPGMLLAHKALNVRIGDDQPYFDSRNQKSEF
ncbi:hypothetical protein N8540_04305 [Gammaproteobacteria bacterium]|nr:hypothetical protein [Gammaproteobacteria bacterium]